MGIAQALRMLDAAIIEAAHQRSQQLGAQLQRSTVLLEGVVAGPGGHLAVVLGQAREQRLVAAGGWIGAGAEQGQAALVHGSSCVMLAPALP